MKTQCTGVLHHLSFPTKDPAATAAFLEKYFTCGIVRADENILLKQGGFDIVLERIPDDAVWPDNFHFGFEMATTQEVEELYQTFKDDGVCMKTGVFNDSPGSRFFCSTPGAGSSHQTA